MASCEVLSVTQTIQIMTSINAFTSSPSKAVISDSSPIKRRRVEGFRNFAHKSRRSSRSGDLTLLRVASAPTEPLPLNHPAFSHSSIKPLSQQRRITESWAETLDRISSLRSSPTHRVAGDTLELDLSHFVSLPAVKSLPRATRLGRTIAAAGMVAGSSASRDDNNASMSQRCRVIKQAEEVAGPTAFQLRQLIPPKDIDSVTRFFDPEAGVSREDITPSPVDQPSPLPGPRATLRERIEALPKGRSLMVIYPTAHGAQKFVNDVLMPILDPLLRRAVNGHGLPDETAKQIRHNCSATLDILMDYDELASTFADVVRTANSNTESTQLSIRFAEPASVSFEGMAWKNAWIQQQREMIRQTTQAGLKLRGGGASLDYNGIAHPKTGVRVAEELLSDLRKHRFEQWELKEGNNKIEFGVFVIGRDLN